MNIPIGKIHHVCLQTSDFERAYDFYVNVMGLGVIKEPFDYKGERQITWLDAGSIVIELNSLKKGTEDQSREYSSFSFGPSHISFMVEDINEVISRLEKKKVKVVKRPFLPPTGDPQQPLVAFIEGSDGDHIELREPNKYDKGDAAIF